jgi:hypothetical protein
MEIWLFLISNFGPIMAIENLKKHIILALLFLIYHFWLYKNIARKNTIKLVLLSDTWERIPSSSLSLSLSFSIKAFPPFTLISFFNTTTAAAAPLCTEEAEEAQGPTEAAATPITSFVVLGVFKTKSFSPISFHSISILFSSSPIAAGLEISSAGWFMLTQKA